MYWPNEMPQVIFALGLMLGAFLFVGMAVASVLEFRKTRIAARQDEDLRRLVQRYEQLAENTVDAQQRVAADVSELRSRTTAIEQILRTVE
jgi:hypothetical protein